MINLFKRKEDPLVLVMHELTKQIGCKISIVSIREKLLRHPAFPSLFSITNVLVNFGVTNKAVRLEPEQLEQLETPFLATTNLEETVLIKNIENGYIEYFSPTIGWQKSILSDFEKLWNQIAILVDTEAKVQEKGYRNSRNLERLNQLRLPMTLVFFSILFFVIAFSFGISLFLPYFFCKVVGLSVALLLVNKEIKKNIKYSFCNVGTKISCDEVLNSPAAKIFNWLSMTDLGLLYFTGTILALVISGIVPQANAISVLDLLILMSFLSLPYTIFSFIYQAFYIKKWCLLCLITIAVLWIESVLSFLILSNFDFALNINKDGVIIFAFCLLLPAIVWMYLKNSLRHAFDYGPVQNAYLRLSNDFGIFWRAHQKQKEVEMDFQSNEVIIGKASASNVILIAINPFCPACAREFDSVLKLLEKHPEFAKIILRFTGGSQDSIQASLVISAMLVSQYLKSSDNFQELLKNWFEIRNPKPFIKKFPIDHNKLSEKILENHYLWSATANITTTPTIFLNGKKFPERYNIDRLVEILSMNPKLS